MIDKKLEGFRGSVVNDSTVTSTAETHVKCTRPCCNPQPKPKVIVRKVYIQKPCKSDRRGEVVYSSTTSKKSVTETFDWGDLDAGDDDCQSCKEEAKASDCGGC